jgi:predicted PurR-regulated permease PerM
VSGESRYWFALALAVALLWLLYLLAPVITPFVISAALAFLGDPLVDRLERFSLGKWRISRSLAVVIVFLLMLAGLVALMLVVIPLLKEQLSHLVERAPAMADWVIKAVLPWVQDVLGFEFSGFDVASLSEALRSYWKEISSALVDVLGTVSRGGQAVLHWVMNLVLIPVVTFYLMRDWDILVEGIRTLIPPQVEPTVSRLAAEINDVLGAFIRGQLIVMGALALIYVLGLWLVGLDLAFIIGLSAGLLSIVPYLGTFLGVIAAVIAAMFQFQDVFHTAMVLLVFAVGQSLEGMVLTPKLVGDRVGLHPVAVIFAVLAGGQLFGFLGVLLALPVASALNVLVRYIHGRYQNSDLFRRAGDAGTVRIPEDD